jgi:hypothetical protein
MRTWEPALGILELGGQAFYVCPNPGDLLWTIQSPIRDQRRFGMRQGH